MGLSIAHNAYHKHTAYVLENADMPGFSRADQQLLALLALGHQGKLSKLEPLVRNHANGPPSSACAWPCCCFAAEARSSRCR